MQDNLELTPILMYHGPENSGAFALAPLHELEVMAARALEYWPALAYKKGGSRAHNALQFVREEQIAFLGETPTGLDRWEVNGYHCSIVGNACACEDRLAPFDDEYGRLCKHRLAAYLQVHLERRHLERLNAIFEDAQAEIVLEVRTYYRYDLHLQTSKLAGFRVDDQGWTQWHHDAELGFRVRDLERILFAHGWRVAPGRRVVNGRHYGGRERWFLEPIPAEDRGKGSRIATAIESLYGRDVAAVEDQGRERRLREMFDENLEAVTA